MSDSYVFSLNYFHLYFYLLAESRIFIEVSQQRLTLKLKIMSRKKMSITSPQLNLLGTLPLSVCGEIIQSLGRLYLFGEDENPKEIQARVVYMLMKDDIIKQREISETYAKQATGRKPKNK